MATLKITKTLTNNVYGVEFTIDNLSAIEQQKIEDFGEPVISLGGTVDVTSDLHVLTLDDVTGVSVGEPVLQGGVSGYVFEVDATAITIYVEKVVGGSFSVGSVTIGAQTKNITAPPTTVNRFQHLYGLAPYSTSDFTVRPIIRRSIPSGLPLKFEFDGNVFAEAEQNALDFVTLLKGEIGKIWGDLMSKTTLWVEETEEVTI